MVPSRDDSISINHPQLMREKLDFADERSSKTFVSVMNGFSLSIFFLLRKEEK